MPTETFFQIERLSSRINGKWVMHTGRGVDNALIDEADPLPKGEAITGNGKGGKFLFLHGFDYVPGPETLEVLAAAVSEGAIAGKFGTRDVPESHVDRVLIPAEYTANKARLEIEALTARVEALEAAAAPKRKAA